MFSRVRFLVVVFIFSMNSSAAPIVSSPINTSGLQQGDSITITGSNFGVKTVAKPLLWADFNQQLEPIASKSQRSVWNSIAGTLASGLSATNSNQALRFDHAASSNTPMSVQNIRNAENNRSQHLYMFARKYYAFDIARDKRPPDGEYEEGTFNLKMYRFYASFGDEVNNHNIHWSYQGSGGIDSGAMTPENTETFYRGAHYSPIIEQKENQWLVHELVYEAGTPGPDKNTSSFAEYFANADGIYDLYEDGIKWTNNNDRFVTHDANLPLLYEDFFFDQVSNGTDAGPNYIYYDEVYMDTTLQRVIICDANVFANCSKRAIQIPTAWANNSITVELNLGEFANFSESLWLYVFDEDGVPNAEGMLIVCESCSDEGLCFPIKSTNGNTAMVCL